jgi:hypothetical protein
MRPGTNTGSPHMSEMSDYLARVTAHLIMEVTKAAWRHLANRLRANRPGGPSAGLA